MFIRYFYFISKVQMNLGSIFFHFLKVLFFIAHTYAQMRIQVHRNCLCILQLLKQDMNETQNGTLPKQLQSLESQMPHCHTLVEHAGITPAPPLPDYQQHDWHLQIAMGNLMPYPSPLIFRNYFIQQCGRLGTFTASELTNQGMIIRNGARITILSKRISRILPRSLSRLAQSAASPYNMHQNWRKEAEGDKIHFEATQNGSFDSPQQRSSWCKILKELMLMWQALYCSRDCIKNEEQKHFSAPEQYVHTILIESFLETSGIDNITNSQSNSPQSVKQQRLESKDKKKKICPDEWTTYLLVISKDSDTFLSMDSKSQYIYVNQQEINEYILEKGSQVTHQKYQRLLQQFQIYNKENTQLFKKYYLMLNLTNKARVPEMRNFCISIKLKSKHYRWKSLPYMQIYNFYFQLSKLGDQKSSDINPESQKDSLKDSEDKKEKKKIELCEKSKLAMKQFFKVVDETCTSQIQVIFDTFQKPYTQGRNSTAPTNDKVESVVQASPPKSPLQKLTQEINQVNQLQKDVNGKKETFLEEAERLIKDTQKRLSLLHCWKEIMVQCKYRCRLGYKCPCQFNQRKLQMEERYLEKLFRYRDRMQLVDNSKKPEPPIENQAESLAVDDSGKQKSTIDLQPSKVVVQQILAGEREAMGPGSGRKERDDKKKRYMCGHSSKVQCKRTEGKKVRLKRGLKDYSEQELNLLNMLDQMDFDDIYRGPCYVDESRISNWKQMGDKYKKNHKTNENIEGK